MPPPPEKINQHGDMLYMFSSYTLFPNTFSSLEAEPMDVEFTDLELGWVYYWQKAQTE